MSGIKAKKKEMLDQARQEAADLLQRSNATIERTIREIKEAKADKEKTKVARAKVEALKQEVGVPKVLKDFKDLKRLKSTLPAAPSPTVSIVRQRTLSFNRTLDLRGCRADEALEKLIAYMDDAQMVGAGEVTILHGTGTGALKQLTRDYLNDLNRQRRKRGKVALDFGDGDVNHGGAGLTIVQL